MPSRQSHHGAADTLHDGLEGGHAVFSKVGNNHGATERDLIGDTVGKLGEVVLGDNIGRISDDRSSGDHDSYRSWARRQSSERTDQSGNDSAAMAALVIS